MKKVKKHLEGITKIMDYSDKYFIVYKNKSDFVTPPLTTFL